MSSLHYYYRCINCGKDFKPERPYYVCPECGNLLLVERDLDYLTRYFSGNTAKRGKNFPVSFCLMMNSRHHCSGVWKWQELILPGFPFYHQLTLNEGYTGLWETPGWLAKEIEMYRLFVKNEGRAPSGSFKDRGMPVAISDALRLQAEYPSLNIRFVVCASTGDTSASAAMYSAYVRDRLKCLVMVPDGKISPAQMYQVMDAGATVLAIKAEDGFDGCMRLVQEFTAAHPDIILVNSKNAMRLAGQETISLEIFEDLGYNVPDWLVVPVGNAGNVAAQMNAWLLLYNLGVIATLPRILIAQTKTANTIVRWLDSASETYAPGKPGQTMASAMNIQNPVSKPRIKHLMKPFELSGIDVAENEIAQTRALFNRAGAGLCTQGGVTLAAALKAREFGLIETTDRVVAINTANDLKFVEAGVEYHQSGGKFANQPLRIEPNLNAIQEAVAGLL